MVFKVPEKYRSLEDSSPEWGNNGIFFIKTMKIKKAIKVIASDGGGWEHVSVSHRQPYIMPSWETMCHVKDLFWSPEDCVIQFHPPKSQYVNIHPNVLHLWRKIGSEFELPPNEFV